MVLDARAAGISASIASIAPQRMPMSRFPRSDWLGSSTSPPLITRSNLSFGPIAAFADDVKRPDSVAAAADPESARKLRRDNADMLTFPPKLYFYAPMMRRTLAFRKPRWRFAGVCAAESDCRASFAYHPSKQG